MTLDNKKTYPNICFQILDEYKEKLASHLSYHSYDHIIDVANVCDKYIRLYKIDDHMAKLIRIAAISHDFGYTVSPIDHEERSITLIEPMLEPILTKDEIAIVNQMIRATKIPQQPKTFYDKILADADLDYLGRNDYDELSENLNQEFLHLGVIKTEEEWLDLQIKFLENHEYHTLYAKWNRRKLKIKKLKELKAKKL
ncbi:MAG: HD domain-containing protein [Bacteroidia bacterium]|nr:HD domain-containing protein [Bacteroidia bacterium]MBT8279529.1 HD domain-containing protein [Bacteroidia bacterium]NND26048.1 HD domain-containing protein [Flavobacteriaceae bacterium]NNK61020.1 HD domain-containing protein [Flavobacteriaceae bacterium]NNL33586.1 HD domain-containing protein [Flavobacteriaceae bacterium]